MQQNVKSVLKNAHKEQLPIKVTLKSDMPSIWLPENCLQIIDFTPKEIQVEIHPSEDETLPWGETLLVIDIASIEVFSIEQEDEILSEV